MKTKIALKISICIFVIIAIASLVLVLNKGHIGSYALVYSEPVEEEEEQILPQLKLELSDEYLS